jgi:fucose permease
MTAIAFRRTRLTWLLYIMLGWFAYLEAGINPITYFLIEDLQISKAVGGLHASAFALGMVIAGLIGDRVADRFGVKIAFWVGGVGVLVGCVGLMVGQVAFITIGGAFLLGILGSIVMVMVQIGLIREHTHYSSVALTEANIIASLTASLVAIAVGAFESIGWGWQWAFLVCMVLWFGMVFTQYGVVFPPAESKTKREDSQRPLSLVFWLYCSGVFLSVSVEWCVWLWSGTYLVTQASLDPATASSLVAMFTIGSVTGRIVSSRLLRTIAPHVLIPHCWAIVAIGFPFFWLGQTPIVNVFGLFVLGLGAGTLFPLGLGAATNAGGEHGGKASSRVSASAGAAILVNPPILGAIADRVGMQSAFMIVILLTVLALAVTFWANSLMKQKRVLSPEPQA